MPDSNGDEDPIASPFSIVILVLWCDGAGWVKESAHYPQAME